MITVKNKQINNVVLHTYITSIHHLNKYQYMQLLVGQTKQKLQYSGHLCYQKDITHINL